MENSTHNTIEAAESRQFSLSGVRLRALLLAVTLGVAFVVVLLAWLPPAYSDDRPGEDKTTFDSPIVFWHYPSGDPSLLRASSSTPGDLLQNGDMDQEGFYWKFPNHYIAGGWYQWFSTRYDIPEYTYGVHTFEKHTPPSSQRIHLWQRPYAGGLMQSVAVTPCTFYRFQAYGHSRPGVHDPPPAYVDSHMKVGIEPNGWWHLPEGKTIPKYPSGFEPEDFPPTVVWSPEATHNFYFMPYSVMAEAHSDNVAVILYSNPEVDIPGAVLWNDTIWDTASLVELKPWPRDTLLDGVSIPQPDGQITALTASLITGYATVEWDTPVAGSTQLLYRVIELSEPFTGTTLLFDSLYLPLFNAGPLLTNFEHTEVSTAPVQHHQVVLTGLPDKYVLEFVALSRWLGDNGCVTSASDVIRATMGSAQFPDDAASVSKGE